MSILRSLRRQNVHERRCLVEAALLHLVVAVGLRTVSYARLEKMLGFVARIPRRTPSAVSDITSATRATGRRLGASCLAEAAVACTMLRRHGHHPRLRIGVRRGEALLEAHAWVECDGTVVMGELPEMTGYAILA